MKKMSEKIPAKVENAFTIRLMFFFFLLFSNWPPLVGQPKDGAHTTGCLILQKKSSNRILSRDWMYKKGKGSCNKMGEVRFKKNKKINSCRQKEGRKN